jgi:sugar/nucleoside kinase (ribokinase family)/fructoselysine-6-P-deglycase FrlB-like protein
VADSSDTTSVTERGGPEQSGPPRVVVVGNLTIDDVVRPDGQVEMAATGGNAVYAALGARLWSPSVGIVTRRGTDFPAAAMEKLRALGIALDGVVEVTGPTVRNWVVYEENGDRHWIHRTPPDRYLEVAVQPGDLPESWLAAGVVHVAGMSIGAAERIVERVRSAKKSPLITLDTHEEYAGSVRERLLSLAARVDVFVPSRDELTEVMGYDDPERAIAELAPSSAPVIIVKLGADGCLVWDGSDLTSVPAVATRVVDVTGAGDAFCGGLAAALSNGLPPSQAAERAVRSASFAVSSFGSLSLAAATQSDRRAIAVMRTDIDAIPALIASQLERLDERIAEVAAALVERKIENLYVTGCGDSFFAGQAATLTFARHAGSGMHAVHALELARYRVRYLPHNSAVLCISYSGSVGRTIEAARQAREFGHRVIALTGREDGDLAAVVDETIVIDVPTSGFSPGTSTYIGLLTALDQLALAWGAARGNDVDDARQRLGGAAEAAARTLAASADKARALAERLAHARWITFLGAGPNLATARFGAAKMLEGPQILGVGTNIEEWAHEEYFVSGAGTPVIVVAPDGAARDRADEILSELVFIGADATLVAERPSDHAEVDFLPLAGDLGEELSPLLAALPLSLFSFFLAEATGKRSYNFPTAEAEREHYETIHRATHGTPA